MAGRKDKMATDIKFNNTFIQKALLWLAGKTKWQMI